MSSCEQEMCGYWTGDGCACAVFGVEATCGPCAAGMHEQCPKLSGCCWHPCSCGGWEGYWTDFHPHVANQLRVIAVEPGGGYSGTEHR